MSAPPVRVRIAPSPTGYVHLGSARTALFNLLLARQRGGSFVLRLDDTDLERNRPEYESAVYEGLRWLNLSWDEGPDVGGAYGPYRQSERLEIYKQAAAQALEAKLAYRCYCTREELQAERKEADRQRVPYRYSRRCLRDPPADYRSRDFTVRLQVPEIGFTSFSDLIRGEVQFENALLGDPVIVKSNGYPTYNFASPVDDALMGVTHILRGEEHLSNTPLQLLVADALGRPRPQAFAHLPVITGKDRKKLSKRLHPETRLSYFQQLGYLPEAMLNYLALLGWNPGTEQEVFSLAELTEVFDLSRVQHAAAMFDWEKLDWLNGHYIRALSDAELAGRLRAYLPSLAESVVREAAPALKERLVRLGQAEELLGYLTQPPARPELTPDQERMIAKAEAALAELIDWTPTSIELALEAVRQAQEWSRGRFFSPIRWCVAGKVSPPLHNTLALLGKEEALRRLGGVRA
ncbi:MAG: glutamate--tRNA ligase [Candidatus Dormibacteraeota bacterium]|nr:glutamate--tRNA ligase [Candidatus Dormibacteraeota bacterium]